MWSRRQLSDPTMGLTSLDQRQPGRKVASPTWTPPTSTTRSWPLGNSLLLSGCSNRLTLASTVASLGLGTRPSGHGVDDREGGGPGHEEFSSVLIAIRLPQGSSGSRVESMPCCIAKRVAVERLVAPIL